MLSHRTQTWQVELQPDDEHQKNDAKFPKVPYRFRVLRKCQSIWPNHYAHRQISQHGGELQRAAHHNAEHSGQQVEQSNF